MSKMETTEELQHEVNNIFEKRSISKERIQRIIDITQKYKNVNKSKKLNIDWVLLNDNESCY